MKLSILCIALIALIGCALATTEVNAEASSTEKVADASFAAGASDAEDSDDDLMDEDSDSDVEDNVEDMDEDEEESKEDDASVEDDDSDLKVHKAHYVAIRKLIRSLKAKVNRLVKLDRASYSRLVKQCNKKKARGKALAAMDQKQLSASTASYRRQQRKYVAQLGKINALWKILHSKQGVKDVADQE